MVCPRGVGSIGLPLLPAAVTTLSSSAVVSVHMIHNLGRFFVDPCRAQNGAPPTLGCPSWESCPMRAAKVTDRHLVSAFDPHHKRLHCPPPESAIAVPNVAASGHLTRPALPIGPGLPLAPQERRTDRQHPWPRWDRERRALESLQPGDARQRKRRPNSAHLGTAAAAAAASRARPAPRGQLQHPHRHRRLCWCRSRLAGVW